MSGTDALVGAVAIAALGFVAFYATVAIGRVIDSGIMTWRVWRMARRHPRAPNKHFPWGTGFSVVIGSGVFWTSLVAAAVLLADWGLRFLGDRPAARIRPALDLLSTHLFTVYGLLFLGIVVTLTIMSGLAWRQEKREREWKETVRRGLK
jgi:hypothetical protein